MFKHAASPSPRALRSPACRTIIDGAARRSRVVTARRSMGPGVPHAAPPAHDAADAVPRRAVALGTALAAALASPTLAARADAETAAAAAAAAPTPTITQRAFLDLVYGDDGSSAGRLVIGLYGDTAPKTVANFVSFLTGTPENPAKKRYAGTPIHRVVKGFVLQGGDVIAGNGTGSTSLYGTVFEDEPGALIPAFSRPGIVAMANRGPNTNGSQFFVTVAPTPFLDGKFAVFGEVIESLDTAVALANQITVDFASRPRRGLIIKDAGLL